MPDSKAINDRAFLCLSAPGHPEPEFSINQELHYKTIDFYFHRPNLFKPYLCQRLGTGPDHIKYNVRPRKF